MEWRTIETLLKPQELAIDELGILSSVVNTSKIIGVGEGAHFVSEFSQARNSIIRYLVERHDFNALGLECGAIQASRLSGWLHSTASSHELEQFSDVLSFSMYGSLLIWLKSYLERTGRKLQLIGIDLPNTLNPKGDLEQLAEAIQIIDPLLKPRVDALAQLLASIDGQSAYTSSVKWGNMDPVLQDKAIAEVIQLKHRLTSLAPILKKHSDGNVFRTVSDRILSIEHTLGTLRIMKNLFDGNSIDGDTSVRDFYMAGTVNETVRMNPDIKMIILAHNNHIQKTPVSFSGELTAIPMGQHLADREDYRSIALTHLGPTVPEMDFPSHDSPVGFSVVTMPADEIREDSIEQHIINTCRTEDSCLILTNDTMVAKRMRSQSASIEANVSEAFNAILCTPSANKDNMVCF